MDQHSELWSEVLRAENDLYAARGNFLRRADVRRELHRALQVPHERGAALRILHGQDASVLIEMIELLIGICATGNSDVGLARQVVARIPRDWRESNLWRYIEPMLLEGDEEEYRRFAELLRELESSHLWTLVDMALASDNEDVVEVGTDFS